MKYPVGMELVYLGITICGKVVENFKLPGDICVAWDNGLTTSYDEDFLDSISRELRCCNCGGNKSVSTVTFD